MARMRVFAGNMSKSSLEKIVKDETTAKKKAKERIEQADANIRGAKFSLAHKASKKK